MNDLPELLPEEKPSHAPHEAEHTHNQLSEPAPEQKASLTRKVNIIYIEERVQAIFSILTKVTIALVVIAVLIFITREILSDGLVIQQISVPEAYAQAGYSGPVLAQRVVNQLNEMIYKTSTYDRAENYTNAFDDNDVSIDMVGFGVPVRGAIELIGETIGIDRKKKIKAAIVLADTSVIMDLNISGELPVRIVVRNNPDPEIPLRQLVLEVSEHILKMTNLSTLDLWYSNVARNAPKTIELSRFMLEKYRGDSLKEALALTSWATALSRQGKDTLALRKLEEALTKAKKLPHIYAAWGSILYHLGKYEEGLQKDKQSLLLLGPDTPKTMLASQMNNISTSYIMIRQLDSAVLYLEKAASLDRYSSNPPYNFACIYSLRKDTVRCVESLSKALSLGYDPNLVPSDPDMAPMLGAPTIKKLLEEYGVHP